MAANGDIVINDQTQGIEFGVSGDDHDLPPLDLVKIDVEYFEPQVVKGMGRLLDARPTLMVEVITEDIGKMLESMLEGRGYLYYRLETTGPVRQETIQQCSKTGKDYLFCTEENARKFNLPL